MSDINTGLKNIIEAALLAAREPLTIDKLLTLFPQDSQPTRDEIREALHALEEDYTDRGIELKQIDRAYRFQTREKYTEWVSRLFEERPPRYSRALLETLAIIAYRQPVTRGDIENIRGVSVSTDIMRTLLEREWIRQVGVRDVPGRPGLYGTTRAFLEYFNLKSLDELPPLAQVRDLATIGEELNLRLDLEPSPDEAASGEDSDSEGETEPEPEASPENPEPTETRAPPEGPEPAPEIEPEVETTATSRRV